MPTAEYPDTTFGRTPNAYGTGRDGKSVCYSVIHYTAGSESRASAEGGNVYDSTRLDGTSCHVFHDPDSSVQEVQRKDRGNSAFHKGNRLGIQHELCGTAQTREQWLDEASDAILWRAARAVAKDCRDYNLEPRRLSVAETRAAWYSYPNGPRGIVGHVDITRAYPEDGGDHTDPGTGFPWDIFIARVQQFLSPQEAPDMTPLEHTVLINCERYLQSLVQMTDPATGISNTVTEVTVPNELVQALNEIKARPQVQPAPIDPASLVAALLHPDVQAVLIAAAAEGANAAEDS